MRYETAGDLVKESDFRNKIELAFRCETHKLPFFWELDCLVTRKKHAVAFAEVKCRNIASDRFPTVFFPCHKFDTYKKRFYWAGTMDGKNLPLLFFVRFEDVDKYVKITDPSKWERERLQARNHEDDPTDIEWVYHIPKEEFWTF